MGAAGLWLEVWGQMAFVWMTLAIGFVIGWQRADSLALRALSVWMLLNSPASILEGLSGDPGFQGAWMLYQTQYRMLPNFAFLLFALGYPEAQALWRRSWVRRMFLAMAVVAVALWAVFYGRNIHVLPAITIDVYPHAVTVYKVLLFTLITSALGALALSWWRAQGQTRQRLTWIALGAGGIQAGEFLTFMVFLVGLDPSAVGVTFAELALKVLGRWVSALPCSGIACSMWALRSTASASGCWWRAGCWPRCGVSTGCSPHFRRRRY